ncbi:MULTISPECIES: glycoside hydrolase [unclassified Mycobacterium]|uniref:glycoside hydrolase n=1 Tax=Mycobacterium sp. E3298 TaxID=1856865 RepID=UPI001E64330A|nr:MULTISPECIES: glycoside hydrolase [unclassified Mycobacterium]
MKLLVVGVNVLANGRSRWLAIVASLVLSAGMVYAQGAKPRPSAPAPPPAAATSVAAGPADAAPSALANAPHTATPAEVEMLTANAPPAAGQQFQVALPHGIGSEDRLQVKTIWAERAISVLFPQITTIGGYREDALPWHPNGLAIDVMIPNHASPEGIELGNQIAGYALANAKRWGINHVIWRQKIYPGVGGGSWTADLGSETLNHYDHVHIATNGGGYPTGHEIYYIASMTPAPQQ